MFTKAFKDLDSVKFRPFLIIIFYLSFFDDEIADNRLDMIINVLKEAMFANVKYFAESDILHQWVLKMASTNKKFTRKIEGT